MLRILAVTNMYPTSRDPTLGTFVEQQIQGLKQVGLDLEVVLLDRAHKGLTVYLSTGRRVRAAIRGFEPDIVHVMYGGVMADIVTSTVDSRPTVVSFCGDDLLGELLSGPVRKFISKCGVLSSHRAARRAHGIVIKSKNLQDVLPSDVSASKIRIIPNGIDFERFKPLDRNSCRNELGWRNDRLNVIFPTNSGDPRKRPELARAAVNAAERLGFTVEMHHLRGVPHDQVPIWLNASDVVLLTSLHEGSPNVIKEALACNVPVVSVDVGDVRERIQGIEGCYLAASETADLASKLALVHAGPRRVAARIKIRDLSIEHVALRLKEFYEEVLLSWRRNHVRSSSLFAKKRVFHRTNLR
jgi:teichuronic acid biosynthesis glycosyltransferase TuaC